MRPLREWFHCQKKHLNEVHMSHNFLCTPEMLELLDILCVEGARCTWLRVELNYINVEMLILLWHDAVRV